MLSIVDNTNLSLKSKTAWTYHLIFNCGLILSSLAILTAIDKLYEMRKMEIVSQAVSTTDRPSIRIVIDLVARDRTFDNISRSIFRNDNNVPCTTLAFAYSIKVCIVVLDVFTLHSTCLSSGSDMVLPSARQRTTLSSEFSSASVMQPGSLWPLR